MPSAVPIFLKMADEKQVIYFTWPKHEILMNTLGTPCLLMTNGYLKNFITIGVDLGVAHRDFSFVWVVPLNCILNMSNYNLGNLTFQ